MGHSFCAELCVRQVTMLIGKGNANLLLHPLNELQGCVEDHVAQRCPSDREAVTFMEPLSGLKMVMV
ncbi:hypothetical protein ANANG_G00156940 [Anguilla anguilla]|uniref:Uncharacterized protein n=1 Tax=Anguilla anguilla TaxID=7936 RepID=A0A9D3M9A8_ANGAN|nr:hypothetical protein ANANG_G00156940 [Anguilla anguilla]